MITVHLIFNAHLDPIWLWSWRDGIDEVLNTSHYICNLLDRNPDVIYTRGEAWVYEQLRRIDPPLFERIRTHVKAGRWSTVGGWYIQPDCNQPSGFALERQISLGQKFFREHFGEVPHIGYNVDSFGHAATLPEYMQRAGQSAYVMMRPQEHEMKLPARLFRWRGYADGPEVTTFRIASAYCTPEGITVEHIQAAASELPEGLHHTMCFVGIGDHGGGPTEAMIEWCRANRNTLPGLELRFSSPEKFFADVASETNRLPLVVGELQMHAVGSFSVHRPVKLALRKAEHRLIQAETCLQIFKIPPTEFARELEIAWKEVCFHHFHDTLGGTCLPSAYEDVHAQLGRALAIGDEISIFSLRRHLVHLKEDLAQRLILFNASDFAFCDYVEIEPWLEWTAWQPSWRLVDERGQTVPHQVLHSEAMGQNQARLLFFITAAPGEMRTVRIVDGPGGIAEAHSSLSVTLSSFHSSTGCGIDLENNTLELPSLGILALPRLSTYEDHTDTWSHGIDRYARENQETVIWQPPELLDRASLMASLTRAGTLGSSRVQTEWRVYNDQPWIDCYLRVVWMEQYRVLKLEWDLAWDIVEREDGIPGGSLIRALTGTELPLRDWTRLRIKNKSDTAVHVAILAPEIYAIDVEPRRMSLTLLRSPRMAWHDPDPGQYPRGIFSDRGEHFFRIRFMAAETLSAAYLDQMAFGWQRPLLTADVTRGMKNRALKQRYAPPVAS
jgi:alpha-mannosidase